MENNKGTMSKMKICSLIAEACFFVLGVTVSLFSITNLDFMGDYSAPGFCRSGTACSLQSWRYS